MSFVNKEAQREYQRKWVANRRAEYFKDKECVRCGSIDRLELDHINQEQKVSHKIWSWSEQRRNQELSNCQPLCYDCHKLKTKEQLTRQFCPKGHDTFKVPRKPSGGCRECAREYDRNAHRARKEALPLER